MDYGNLAQMTNPGPALDGMEMSSIRRWHDMNNLQQQALSKAAPLAEMNAEQQALSHSAFVAAQPSRMNQSTLANMQTGAAVQNFDRDQALKSLDAALQDKDKRAQLEDFTKDIGEAGSGYLNAKNDEEKRSIIESVRGKSVRGPGGKTYVMGSSPMMDDMLLTASGRIKASKPELVSKENIAAANNERAITVAALKEAGLDERLNRNLSVKEAIARIKAAEAAKPLNEGQGLIRTLDARYKPDSAEWLEAYTVAKSYAASIKPEQAAGTANSMLSGKGIQVPPVAPAQFPAANQTAPMAPVPQAPIAAPATAKPQFEKGKIYQDAKGNKAKWNGTSWEPVR